MRHSQQHTQSSSGQPRRLQRRPRWRMIPMSLAPLTLVWLALVPRLAIADDPPAAFQVTIEILDAESGQQLDRHLVLFDDGKAYDFALSEPRDVTVVDPVASKVILLSRSTHEKTTINNQDIVNASARVRLYAKNEGIEERLGMAAAPESKPDPAPGQKGYRVTFAGYRYDATATTPTSPMQPERFAEFTDWVARVNLIRSLGTPPFARMKLGRTIGNDGLVPSNILLRIESDGQQRTLESRYTFKDQLSDAGKKRINEAASMLELYREVPLESFPR
ncbi:hypothetical protein NHH03_19875 [Stieleria sp. TO1_6]|uniref:hypothetical protein n=1 Tax=Stieleria tagensis TaxID=2956795 RepID=UPI00209B3698|nr:hypothetical protein [Stieleria tagensis]MCO8124013.1 hypothetical protein [Stieleria tagensis]